MKALKMKSILFALFLSLLFPAADLFEPFALTYRVEASETKEAKNFLKTGLEDFLTTRVTSKKKVRKYRKKKTTKKRNSRKKQRTQVQQQKATVNVPSTNSSAAELTDYVVNVNTKKFHLPYCHTIKRMKAKNRKDLKTVRDELIQSGYSPCKVCNP